MKDAIKNIQGIFSDFFPEYSLTDHFCNYTIKEFLRVLPAPFVQDSMDKACTKMDDGEQAISYFCGICWKRIKAGNPIEPTAIKKCPPNGPCISVMVMKRIVEIKEISPQDRRNIIAIYTLGRCYKQIPLYYAAARMLKIPEPKIAKLFPYLKSILSNTSVEGRS